MIAALAAVVRRLLSGPAEHPVIPIPNPSGEADRRASKLQMSLQAAVAAVVIVALNQRFDLEKSAWAKINQTNEAFGVRLDVTKIKRTA
jgi:hypothetical protein